LVTTNAENGEEVGVLGVAEAANSEVLLSGPVTVAVTVWLLSSPVAGAGIGIAVKL